MRIKRSRIRKFYVKKANLVKDKEGCAHLEYAEAALCCGAVWPASGKIQAKMYGNRLNYIRNVKLEGDYYAKTDSDGVLHYVTENGLDIVEGDGMCLYVSPDEAPDYKIISVKPYENLRLEVEKI